MAWTVVNPVAIGAPTKKSDYDKLWDNCDYFKIDHNTDGTHEKLTVGSDADGDIYYRAGGVLTRLPKGTALYALLMNAGATAPAWTASLQSLMTAQGDIVYASAANTPARLPKGTALHVMRMNSGGTIPEWAAATVPDGSVAQAKLATSQGSVSTVGAGNYTLPGGEYGFREQVKDNASSTVSAHIAVTAAVSLVYATNIHLTADVGGNTVYAQQRYITASGEIFWLFMLRDKLTGNILSMWQSPDHPCFGNSGKPNLLQHPFADVRENRWLGSREVEIIVVNPAHDMVQEAMFRRIAIEGGYPDKSLYQNYMSKAKKKEGIWMGALRTWEAREAILADTDEEAKEFLLDYQGFIIDENRPNRDLLEVFRDDYQLDAQAQWSEKVCTVALPDEDLHGSPVIDWRMMPAGTPVEPIKTKIMQPQDSLLYNIKEK